MWRSSLVRGHRLLARHGGVLARPGTSAVFWRALNTPTGHISAGSKPAPATTAQLDADASTANISGKDAKAMASAVGEAQPSQPVEPVETDARRAKGPASDTALPNADAAAGDKCSAENKETSSSTSRGSQGEDKERKEAAQATAKRREATETARGKVEGRTATAKQEKGGKGGATTAKQEGKECGDSLEG
ncbi:hypothetical protein SYNPS1DRAFT_30770 [Syncephalis pseudoplumigaleata]|uniref:Uncharacterized protein n=1 Tax=Syncephalis pseudoplumigaleata TaxID=1712513 RepID=A0A4P9YUH3_9FUNG|nr:hypothetical protein SYNPS1DRAFT_30770 [Syncephalis pseudoplumigaleata]|eukprot:RKP23484.1 hypothetical protein SYNPS1DRAFT_30770 [Syncephalis pseudoplumigaleata]